MRRAKAPNLDVVDALSFMFWQTARQVASAANVDMKEATRTIKLLVDGDWLDVKGRHYRYGNAWEEK